MFSHVTDVLAQIKIVTTSKKRQPWFTSMHRELILKKDRLYRGYCRSRMLALGLFFYLPDVNSIWEELKILELLKARTKVFHK